MRSLASALVLASLAVLAASCGSGGGARPQFLFTPYPYTIVPVPSAGPVLMSLDENGDRFQPDQFFADVEDPERFLKRVEELGFQQFGQSFEMGELTRFFIMVPPGASPAAVRLLKNDRNVKYISVAYFGFVDD